MSTQTGPFEVNRDEVAAKVIDGELIVIRLSDGTYYSTENVGTVLWQLLESHYDVAQASETLAGWFTTDVERVAPDVHGVVEQMCAERLLRVVDRDSAAQRPVDRPDGLMAYETPRLNIYRDMGNLLALDPPTPGIDELLFKDRA